MRVRRAPRLSIALAAFAAVLVACPASPSTPKFLENSLILPKNPHGVFLNEDLIFFFSEEIDRASVTQESVRIATKEGRLARGTFSISGKVLTFSPAPVLARELNDGGYLPDSKYEVEIRGFPYVDGLRGTGGSVLQRTLRFAFDTVSVSAPSDNLVFGDAAPELTRPLGFFPPPGSPPFNGYAIQPQDPIYLDCDKPVDPSSVRDEDLVLRHVDGAQVAVRARLLENEGSARVRPRNRLASPIASDAAWEREPRAALIELRPVERLARGTWYLSLGRSNANQTAPGPRDFSGHSLWSAALSRPIEVGDRGPEGTSGVFHEDFVDRRLLSPVSVPGTDGTARWSDTGRVEVRYPAAAGDGSSGHLALSGSVDANDVQAQTLTIASGATCALAATGCVVLRCQGRFLLSGKLVRDARREGEDPRIDNDPLLDLAARGDTPKRARTLSSWLASIVASGRTCTVLIAGGDLVIDSEGELRTNTPLLLVAGGTVRVTGSVRGISGGIFVLGDGGGSDIQPPKSDADLLWIDPPVGANPLREELHYAVMSGSIPQRGTVEAWLSAEARGSAIETRAGGGLRNRWSVRYVREFEGVPASLAALAPVDDPRILEHPGAIQLLIELWVVPGPVFDPPFVDFVHLTYEKKKDDRR